MYWSRVRQTSCFKKAAKKGFNYFVMFLSYLFYAGLASNYCVLYSTIPLGMFRSALTYKAEEVHTFLGVSN